jgi:Holliday junction resolvasome RuvABC endonuclease subunit
LLDISSYRTTFGIDPGTTKLGLAKIHFNKIYTFQISLERKRSAMSRILGVQSVLSECIKDFGKNPIAVIEGAAYGNPYRQVELAEVRAAMGLWFHSRGIEVIFAPPQSVRKTVFGSAKIKNPWKDIGIQDDVAAAIGCAYYGLIIGL